MSRTSCLSFAISRPSNGCWCQPAWQRCKPAARLRICNRMAAKLLAEDHSSRMRYAPCAWNTFFARSTRLDNLQHGRLRQVMIDDITLVQRCRQGASTTSEAIRAAPFAQRSAPPEASSSSCPPSPRPESDRTGLGQNEEPLRKADARTIEQTWPRRCHAGSGLAIPGWLGDQEEPTRAIDALEELD